MANEDQAQPNNKGKDTTSSDEIRQAAMRSDAVTLGDMGKVKTKQATSNATNQTQSFLSRAFEPETWSQWVLAIFAAVAVVFAYKAFRAAGRQADTAEKQLALATSPRLYTDGVRASSLEVGTKPVFFVKIVNSGPADAESVAVSIDVRFGDGSATYKNDHVMMIPANTFREHFIFPGFEIHNIDEFNSGSLPVEISGHFINKGKEVKYCYKYNPWPWDDPRPDGWPVFVPCDFVATRAITAKMRGGSYSLSYGNVEGKQSSKQ